MKTTTLEFSKTDGRITVTYNFETMSLADFCRFEGARKLLIQICNAVRAQYREENPCTNPVCLQAVHKESVNCNIYPETVGTFIKKHFLKNDIVFDVIISEDSDRVYFNFESG